MQIVLKVWQGEGEGRGGGGGGNIEGLALKTNVTQPCIRVMPCYCLKLSGLAITDLYALNTYPAGRNC